MTPPWPAPDYALEQYEALRREALENAFGGRRGQGLSLFVTQGMSAWLRALSLLVPRPVMLAPAGEPFRASAGVPSERPALPSGARSDMSRALARMVLAVGWEGL